MFSHLCLLLLLKLVSGGSLDWLMGTWRSEYNGKIRWPSVPNMNYGEELKISRAESSNMTGVPEMFKYESFAWSHSSKDHFLDVYGYLSQDSDGFVNLFTVNNNGFNTAEKGQVVFGLLQTFLTDIARINIAREIPVEDIKREIRLIDDNTLEQVVHMRTITHPKTDGMLEHARVTYKKIMEPTHEEF